MGLLKLTESERLEILNLHNNARIIKEQVPVVVTQQTPMDDTAKIKAIQTALNTKYKSNLKVDGILGTNTLTSLSTAMKSKVAPAAGAGTSGTAVAPVGPVAAAGTSGTAVGPVAAADEFGDEAPPQSNRRARQDLRRGNRRAMQDLKAQQ